MSAMPAPEPVAVDISAPPAVALLRVDQRLRGAVPEDEQGLAERIVVVPAHELSAGRWSPEVALGDGARPFAVLLLRGMVTHEITVAGRRSANLLGPGDLFRPWRDGDASVPYEARWTATHGTEIAVLDGRFVMATRRWPRLSTVVYDRLAEQLEAAAVRAAIVGLPRVEERVLALFWQLADHWGIVTADGVVVRLALTHAAIGRLVAARRPTVSLALHALADAGLLWRGATDDWVLARDSRATLAADCVHRFDTARSPTRRRSPVEADRATREPGGG
jgi:CRP/FNR family transcriptional regulator, cyclic AMP receptor protein